METTTVLPTDWPERAHALLADGWWLADLCGVDRLGLADAGARFEVVVHLLHRGNKQRQRIHVPAAGEPPTVPSIVPVWPGAKAFEREAYDMFGIVFDGHDDLKRILMPDEWEGHPLRKDYGVGKVPIEFIPQPFLQIDSPQQGIDADEAGVEVDHLGQVVRGGEMTGGAELPPDRTRARPSAGAS